MPTKPSGKPTDGKSEQQAESVSVSIGFPDQMLNELTGYAKHIGVDRNSLIKMWIAEKLKA